MCGRLDLPGIYAIRCLVDSKNTTYIGQAANNIRHRFAQHRSSLRYKHHHNTHLQSAWNLYGEDAFQFVVLENVDSRDILVDREKHWLELIRSTHPVYNCGEIVESPRLGVTNTLDHNMRAAATRYAKREETGRKISLSLRGKKQSEEAVRKRADAIRGRKRPVEFCQALSRYRSGKVFTRKAYPSFINIETGEIIPAGENLASLCRKYGFKPSGMRLVVSGKLKKHHGWKLYNG